MYRNKWEPVNDAETTNFLNSILEAGRGSLELFQLLWHLGAWKYPTQEERPKPGSLIKNKTDLSTEDNVAF